MSGVAEQMELAQFAAWAESAARRAEGASAEPALKRCLVLLVAKTKENFAGSHAPDGTAWPPLVLARPRGGDKPLRDTGTLMASLSAGGPGHVEEVGEDSLLYGTNAEHAATQQNGATILPVNAKALAVPRTREAARAGSPRQFGKPLVLVWAKGARSGGLYEERGRGKSRRLVLQFLLLPKAVIPPRPFLGWNDEMAMGCERILAEWFEKEVRG